MKNNRKKLVSFSGMAKTKLSEKELNEEIKKAKRAIIKHNRLSDFAGILTKKEADEAEKRIHESRDKSRKRMERIRKRLNE